MLALNGGTPIRRNEEWPKWPIHTPETTKALQAVLESQRWSISGTYAGAPARDRTFSEKWAAYNGVKYAVGCTNGSAALLIALEALDVGAGDEVIVPGLCWIAPATAALNVNARAVMVDVDPNTFCLDPAKVKAAITPRTKAIIAVHLYGSMSNLDELLAIGAANKIPVIEDCAQSHGSQWNGKNAGSHGVIGTFSFHHGKPFTSGEGGSAITNDPRLYQRLQNLRSDSREWVNHTPKLGHMELAETAVVQGSNHALSEFSSAILTEALTRIDDQIKTRLENALYLDEQLLKVGGIVPQARPKQVTRQSFYHYMVRLEADQFAGKTNEQVGHAVEAEIGFWIHPPYVAMKEHKLYVPHTKRRWKLGADHEAALNPARFELPVSQKAHRENLVFHHSVLLGTRAQMDSIVEAFAKVKKHASEIK
ncbi:MAG: DegT/DnrJ/EryC1/StrS family aminotransferase [Myxococcaceae bacterium]|nr:DegT/DnrJ/EryC1/StrS family aminotransferase [Myxococcaceae bacterium]